LRSEPFRQKSSLDRATRTDPLGVVKKKQLTIRRQPSTNA